MKKILAFALALAMILTCSLALADRLDDIKAAGKLTGNRKYMHFADSEFRATYNHLYDKDEDLFYRDSRYIGQKEANGKKIFWGRGNGWVIGGLAEILKTLPAEDTEFRPFYLELYKEMSERLAGLQGKDGYWHASLLDQIGRASGRERV